MRPHYGLIFCTVLMLSSISCRKKAEIEFQVIKGRQSLEEFQVTNNRLKAELAAMSDLGKYNHTRASQIDELKAQVVSLKSDIEQVKKEIVTETKNRDAARIEVESYRAKYDNY